MSFPRYPKYKDSGVEWLGEVPAHWDVCALKRIVNMQSGEAITAENIEEAGDYPVFGGNGLRGYTTKFTHDGEFVLIGRQGALCGNVNYASGRFWASEHAVVASPIDRLDMFWLGELLRAMHLNQYSVAAAQPGLSVDLVGRLGITVPPLPEQVAIGTFLCGETSKIDGLVAEQRRLLELLEEKRQAVISHAVTKGLNAGAPMKPSGIEWLGEVPEHWTLKRLKDVTRQRQGIQMGPFGGMLKNLLTESAAFKLYGQENTIRNDFQAGSRWLSREHFESLLEYELEPGDIVLTRKGASIGHCRLVPAGIQRGVIDSDTIRVRLEPTLISVEFAVLLMHEGYLEAAILQQQKGAVLPGLNSSTIANLQIALPPLIEQDRILFWLRQQLEAFDALTAETVRAIDLLQERRAALISAAVTGQIDVRGLVEAA